MTQGRPKGRFVPVDPAWIARVKAELDRRGWNQGDLARRLGATDAALSDILNGKRRSSRLVDAINLALDIAPPNYEDDIDQDMHEAMRRLRRINRDLFDKIVTDAKREIRATSRDPDDKS